MLLSILLAPFDPPFIAYAVSGDNVSGSAFFQKLVQEPLVGVVILTLSITALAFAYGIFNDRPWTRPLGLYGGAAVWFLGAIGTTPDEVFIASTLIASGITAALLYRYMFKRPNVTAYYDAIED